MKRTQIYLQESQKAELDALAKQTDKSLAEVIREAIDLYIIENTKKTDVPFLQTSGLWQSRNDIHDSIEYVNTLRSAMDSHMEVEKT